MKKPNVAGTIPTWPTTKKIPGKGSIGSVGRLPKGGKASRTSKG